MNIITVEKVSFHFWENFGRLKFQEASHQQSINQSKSKIDANRTYPLIGAVFQLCIATFEIQ